MAKVYLAQDLKHKRRGDSALRLHALQIVAAALTVAALVPEPVASQSTPARTKLANGLEVIVVENHTAPLATVLVAVRNGAFVQQPGEEGLAHLYEHLVFRAYGPEPGAFDNEVAGLKGVFNGTTSEEVVTYYLMVPSEKAGDAIGLLARALSRVRFKPSDLEEERPVVLDELRRAESDPEQVLGRRVAQQLWQDAWYRKDVSGDSASLPGISLDRLREVFQHYYLPNNAALIVTGDVSAPAVFDLARRRFGDWKPGTDPVGGGSVRPVSPLPGDRAVVVVGSMEDVTILIALRGPALLLDTADTYAADVLFEVLNEPRSGFQRRLVESGLFQSISGEYRAQSEYGPILIHAKTTAARATEALTALVGELDQLDLLLDITQEDLSVGRMGREVSMALAWEQTARMAPMLAAWWASGGIDYYLTYRQRADGQTLEDVRAFVHKYVTGKPRVVGVLGSPAVAARLAEWLQGQVGHHP